MAAWEIGKELANSCGCANELERNRRIYKKKMVSSDTFERLKFEYAAQKAAYELAQLNARYATIKAPIDGIVSERLIKVGNMVNVNQAVFKITDFDSLHAIIHVPEKELSAWFELHSGEA